MAQATNPKIEELRFRLKTDPKSRIFYQLAEELRRAIQFEEAEQVLRSGLENYPTYLAAWVSLGRVLREQKKEREAVDALTRAMQIDPGNAVAARLMADAWMELGEKVEAIKKYKLVHALLPSDENLRNVIERLEQEIGGAPAVPLSARFEPEAAEPPPLAPVVELAAAWTPSEADPSDELLTSDHDASAAGGAETSDSPEAHAQSETETLRPVLESEPPSSPFFRTTESPFAEAGEAFEGETVSAEATRDSEPMHLAHSESPFEEPVDGYAASAIEVEAPPGITIREAPMGMGLPSNTGSDEGAEDRDSPFGGEEPAAGARRDAGDTKTMADLYVKQGLVEDAAKIYESILERDPQNAEVREKLASVRSPATARIGKLEKWLSKIAKKEVEGV